jgi:hypothetical protein
VIGAGEFGELGDSAEEDVGVGVGANIDPEEEVLPGVKHSGGIGDGGISKAGID